MDERGGAHRQEEGACCRVDAALQDRRIDRLAEPDDPRAREIAARRAAGRTFRWRRPVLPARGPSAALLPTLQVPDRAVKANHSLGTGPLMEPVDVLRDEREVLEGAAPCGKNRVRRVRLARSQVLTPPVVPFPDEFRIPREGLRCRQVLGSMLAPESFDASECRDTGIRSRLQLSVGSEPLALGAQSPAPLRRGRAVRGLLAYSVNPRSLWSAISRPSDSVSVLTRRPTMLSTILAMTNVPTPL